MDELPSVSKVNRFHSKNSVDNILEYDFVHNVSFSFFLNIVWKNSFEETKQKGAK